MAKRPLAFYLGLALVTMATLMVEVINVRIFSVLTWYHLGFFAISMALLGITAGACYLLLLGPVHVMRPGQSAGIESENETGSKTKSDRASLREAA